MPRTRSQEAGKRDGSPLASATACSPTWHAVRDSDRPASSRAPAAASCAGQRRRRRLVGNLRTWRDRAMAGLMVFCGLRAGEVLALEVSDVDIGGRWLRVFGKGSKERRVPLDVDVAGDDPDLPARRASRDPDLHGCSWWRRDPTAASPSPRRACARSFATTERRPGSQRAIRMHSGTPSAPRSPKPGLTWPSCRPYLAMPTSTPPPVTSMSPLLT